MNDSAAPAVRRVLRLPPWPVLAALSGLLVGLSQPILIESIGGKAVLDGTGLSGLLVFIGLVPAFIAIDGQGPKRAYAVGFVTWLVAFSTIVHWILTTVHVYGGLPLVVGLAVLLLLTSAMAAYVASSSLSLIDHPFWAMTSVTPSMTARTMSWVSMNAWFTVR